MTLNLALKQLNNIDDQPILSVDCDHFFTHNIVEQWNGENKLITIYDSEPTPIFSYVKSIWQVNGLYTKYYEDILGKKASQYIEFGTPLIKND